MTLAAILVIWLVCSVVAVVLWGLVGSRWQRRNPDHLRSNLPSVFRHFGHDGEEELGVLLRQRHGCCQKKYQPGAQAEPVGSLHLIASHPLVSRCDR